jgi:hypothetical protein
MEHHKGVDDVIAPQLQRLKMSDERPVIIVNSRLKLSDERPVVGSRLKLSDERSMTMMPSYPNVVNNAGFNVAEYHHQSPPAQPILRPIKAESVSLLAMQNAVAAELSTFLDHAAIDPVSPNFRFFELVRQPKPKQRKSYRTENRYLAPNPLTIRYCADGTPHGDLARPRAGGVSVSLVDVLGRPLDVAVQKELAGGARKVFACGACTAVTSFSLKMHVTSRGEELRLAFDIDWIGADGMARRERVLSDAFRINTNLRRTEKSPPRDEDEFVAPGEGQDD